MEKIMLIVNSVIVVCNLLILLGVAGTVTKIFRHLVEEREEHAMPVREGQLLDLPTGQLYRDERGQLIETGPATYADSDVLAGRSEPYSDGVTNRPSSSNWDGIKPQV